MLMVQFTRSLSENSLLHTWGNNYNFFRDLIFHSCNAPYVTILWIPINKGWIASSSCLWSAFLLPRSFFCKSAQGTFFFARPLNSEDFLQKIVKISEKIISYPIWRLYYYLTKDMRKESHEIWRINDGFKREHHRKVARILLNYCA